MKKKFLFMSMLASLLMTGCSQDEGGPGEEGGNNGNGETTTSYMAVNLMSPNNAASRATAADGYEDGSSDENTVNNVRFYFFDGAGGAAYVKLNGSDYVNYYDWENPTQNEDTEKDDIEKLLSATIVISTKHGDKLPQMIAAVINPPTDNDGKIVWGDGSKSLTALQEVTANYAANSLTTSGKFVMFNSIYVNGSTEVNAVPITSDNLQKKPADAEQNPVTIYVERSVAKVRVNIDNKAGFVDGKLALKSKEGNTEAPILVGGKQVYLQLNGWSLTANTDKGRLVKKINPAWQNTWWKGEHRTFWAINDLKAKNQWHSYSEIGTSIGTPLYTNENAAKNDGEAKPGTAQSNTKVILKGTLCDEDGEPFTIVRHLGAYFADTYNATDESKNLTALKDNILSQLVANGLNYYYETTETQIVEGESKNVTVRKQIDKNDIKIVIADQIKEEEKDNNCYVYAQLTDDAAKKTWYNTLDESTTENPINPIAFTEINKSLSENVDKALVWQSGMTYYYYEIKHLKNDQTQDMIGVVRNHIYDTNVTKILGLGTPVYDPTQEIYPEKPSKNDHYIAAEIKILSWRVVNNDYILDWN